ncbi:MAG TPA: hypothetical protein VFZ31_00880 [Vicinamibacterales bacterium]
MPVVALLVLTLFAQAPLPNFSGKWNMVAARSGSPLQTPPVSAMTFAIEQQADQISIESTTGNAKTITVIYPIVPAPKQPADPLGAGLARAYWDGKRLVIEQGGTISGQTVSMKQSLTMDPASGELIVERLVIVQHGYTLKGAQNYSTVKDVFARSAQ